MKPVPPSRGIVAVLPVNNLERWSDLVDVLLRQITLPSTTPSPWEPRFNPTPPEPITDISNFIFRWLMDKFEATQMAPLHTLPANLSSR